MLTISVAAKKADLSEARIRRLIDGGILTAQLQPILGTRIVRTVLDEQVFEEWLSTRASRRRRKYIIEVSDADIGSVLDFLANKGIGIKRKNVVRHAAKPEPFADIWLPDGDDAVCLDDLAEEPTASYSELDDND